MKLISAAGIAGLVIAAAAAPVAALTVSGATDDPSDASPLAAHATSDADPDDSTEPEDADEPAGPAHPTGTEQAAAASAAGRAHAEAMKVWARCVADAASGPKDAAAPVPPKLACGEKPMGPGRARHLATSSEATTPDPAPPRTQPRHGSHGGAHGRGHRH
jgi:hypothetical protein